MLCTKCNNNKEENEFAFKIKAKNIRSSICRSCHNTYSKKHYISNKKLYLAKAKRNGILDKEKTKNLLNDLKIHCIKCNESHPATLDFHHVNPYEKENNVSKLRSRKAIIEESKKCIVLCSNCHRKLHYDERNKRA